MKKAMMLAVLAAALVAAAPAAAGTYELSGRQTVVNEEQGIYKMRGSLIGRWTITAFEEVNDSPYFHGVGTERFRGCLDRRRDRSCKGDPSGTLTFSFDYYALFEGEALVWGGCGHPVTGGTGDFAGAVGVVMMADTPTKSGVKTAYIGNLTLKRKGKSARHARVATASVRRSGCVAR
jgi:hypothetical protein